MPQKAHLALAKSCYGVRGVHHTQSQLYVTYCRPHEKKETEEIMPSNVVPAGGITSPPERPNMSTVGGVDLHCCDCE